MRDNLIKKQLIALKCIVALLFLLFLPTHVTADKGIVTCRYLKASGNVIKLQINVSTPPPATIIVIQKIPAGSTIKKSTPEIKKLNNKKRIAKWLFRKIKPGSFIIEMVLDHPVQPEQLTGQIRYKNPETGMTITMEIAPDP
jgi:hypothetical protein